MNAEGGRRIDLRDHPGAARIAQLDAGGAGPEAGCDAQRRELVGAGALGAVDGLSGGAGADIFGFDGLSAGAGAARLHQRVGSGRARCGRSGRAGGPAAERLNMKRFKEMGRPSAFQLFPFSGQITKRC